VAPAQTAHRFEAVGSERLRLVSVVAAARMETTWLA
jgi:mannose-6-phosphate isomerase-like protein (cupin superfamily)